MVSSTGDILLNNRLDQPVHLAGPGNDAEVVVLPARDSTPRQLGESMRNQLFDRLLFASSALVCILVGIGCAGGGGASVPPITGVSAETTLEWDDLDAAVSYVAVRHGLALVERLTVPVEDDDGLDGVVRRYLLVDSRDRPVEIRFSTDPGALAGLRGASASRSGSVVVRAGRFGDDQRERALVAALLERLDALVAID